MMTIEKFNAFANKYIDDPWQGLRDLVEQWKTVNQDNDLVDYLCAAHWIFPYNPEKLQMCLPPRTEVFDYQKNHTGRYILSVSGCGVDPFFVDLETFVHDKEKAEFAKYTKQQLQLIERIIGVMLSLADK